MPTKSTKTKKKVKAVKNVPVEVVAPEDVQFGESFDLRTPTTKINYVVDTTKDTVFKKCKYNLCRNLVDSAGNGLFCCHTCELFFNRNNNNKNKSKSKYKESFAKSDLFQYLQKCELSHLPFYNKTEHAMIPIKKVQLPSVEGYASYLGFSYQALTDWSKKYPDFREALRFIKQVQKNYLMNNGLSGVYNQTITSLLLKNNHGMKEKIENTTNHYFGVVKEIYERADSFQQDALQNDPFEGIEAPDNENDI